MNKFYYNVIAIVLPLSFQDNNGSEKIMDIFGFTIIKNEKVCFFTSELKH